MGVILLAAVAVLAVLAAEYAARRREAALRRQLDLAEDAYERLLISYRCMCDRVAGQAELLARRSERKASPDAADLARMAWDGCPHADE